MCIRDSRDADPHGEPARRARARLLALPDDSAPRGRAADGCLLYTSDAADERSSVDLGGRRIIKKKKQATMEAARHRTIKTTESNHTQKKRT